MLDAAVIMDQKQSPGLIEVPCMQTLRALAAEVPADEAIVELGSFMGRSTAILALGASEGHGAQVHAFDPWEDGPEVDSSYAATAPTVADYRLPETRAAFDAHMMRTGASEQVTAHVCTAVEGAKAYDGPAVGLLWVDALHDYDSVVADLKAWLPKMAKAAVVVLHDVGDPRYAVLEAAEAAFTRTKALREKWAWDGREIVLWAKQPAKRGFAVIRTR